ncbi:hypothetical protein KL918_002128 [Ogataea parapolymorpha]|nr:hypothetical protein KL918_002128 [Ogataea parapolymorpha]KAG7873392.1 hypothetical protein KL916_002341 [Ogataea parapolymorpha]
MSRCRGAKNKSPTGHKKSFIRKILHVYTENRVVSLQARVQPSLPRASGQPVERALSRDIVWQVLSQLQATIWSCALCFTGAVVPNAQHDPDFGPHHCDSTEGLPGRVFATYPLLPA